MIAVLILNAVCLHVVSSYSTGAPTGVCESMTPDSGSHGALPQKIESPFKVVTDKSYFKPGEPVTVTIQSSGNNRFEGLLVQAREVGKTNAIGTFSGKLPPGVKYLTCSRSKGAVTHSAKGDWGEITLEWSPPSDVTRLANVTFLATVVRDKATFWVKQESMQLYNKRVVDEMATISVVSSSMMATMKTMTSASTFMYTGDIQMSTYMNKEDMQLSTYMETLRMINATKTMNMAQQSIKNGKTCAPEKCSAITFLPNTIIVFSSAFLLFLACQMF